LPHYHFLARHFLPHVSISVQALTQIQEITLTFVPKIVVMFFVLMLLLPFILNELTVFMGSIVDRIVNIS